MPWSPYMARIRAAIGTDLLLTPAAGIAAFDDDRRVLLLRHGHDGRWGTPGGGMEPGEAPVAAAAREFTEETGLVAHRPALIDAFGGPDFEVVYPGGAATAYVVLLYGTRHVSGDLVLQRDEVVAAGRFTQEEVAGLDVPPDMQVMLPRAFAWFDATA